MLTCVLSQCFRHTCGTVTFNLDPLQIRSPGMDFSEIYGLTNPPELMKEKERAVRKLAVKRRRKLLCRYKSREGC